MGQKHSRAREERHRSMFAAAMRAAKAPPVTAACLARREGDEWVCATCGVRWAVDEGSPCRRVSA